MSGPQPGAWGFRLVPLSPAGAEALPRGFAGLAAFQAEEGPQCPGLQVLF